MSRTITFEMAYDAPVERVAAMLGDRAFRQEVCDYMGVLRVDITIETHGPDDTAKTVVLDQWQATAGIPSFAKKIVGDETNVVQREEWSTPTHADVTVTIPGKPGEMTGTATLREVDGGTVESVEMTVKVKVPLIAGKLEGVVGDLLLKALKAEYKVGRDYLSRSVG